MKAIKINGVDQNVWKMELEKCDPNPSFVESKVVFGRQLLAGKKGKNFKNLELATSSCTGKLLMSERCLIYRTSAFLPPDAITAIDTENNLLYTAQGPPIRAKISIVGLSMVEEVFVQNARRDIADNKWKDEFQLRLESVVNEKTGFRQQTEEPVDENVAQKAFALIMTLDSNEKLREPSVFKVIHYYCLENLSANEVAKKCGCSKGTIMNRLSQIKQATGIRPIEFRRYSSQFEQFEKSISDHRARKIDRTSMVGGPGYGGD